MRLLAAAFVAWLLPGHALPAFLHSARRVQASAARERPLLSLASTDEDSAEWDAERDAVRAAESRPIITGCLLECGVRDQSCVTDCQVCVEEHGCPTVKSQGCEDCLHHAQEARRSISSGDDVMVDSGGASLLRDGVRNRLELARMKALDGKRLLYFARNTVLKAQRQAEWAIGEHSATVAGLRKMKGELKTKEEEAANWKLQSAEELNATRAEEAAQLAELEKREGQLTKAKRRLKRLRKQLLHEVMDGKRLREEVVAAKAVFWRRARRAKEEREKLQRLRDERQKTETNTKRVGKALSKELASTKQEVRKVLDRLRTTRAMDRLSREELDKAKQRYREAVAMSHRRDATVTRLRGELSKHPLPTFVPPEDDQEY
mmetsp:Transcript_86305/g.279456  ORF Transcript_86305/g.279456 Transcript_86305/m.279456 type:complete len:376 (+) Transcript_86305:143-1270(+)